MRRVLVIGSGITGCAAALELAHQGYSVDVLESAAGVGGKILGYCCKATIECARCGVCVAHTRVAQAVKHPNIRFLAAMSLQSVRRDAKGFAARAVQQHPAIRLSACTACGACAKACPARCITRYNRGGLVQYSINHAKCLRRRRRACAKCVAACPAAAIAGDGLSGAADLSADAVLVATGHQAFDARGKPWLGYSQVPNVLNGEEAEAILANRMFLRGPNDDVAFVQCVGSRDPELGRNYCSAVCCAYATRMARVIRHRNPASNVTVYLIDLQNFDKTFSRLRAQLAAEGVRLVRSAPSSIDPLPGGRLSVKREGVAGAAAVAEHDVVVLSVGMGPAAGAAELADQLGLRRDEFGFFEPGTPGVFVAGTCAEPRSILDSIASGEAVAAQILEALADPGRPARESTADNPNLRKIKLSPGVLVLGGGLAGARVAGELKALGYRPVVLEQAARTGGGASSAAEFERLLADVDVLTDATLSRLTGCIGSFHASVRAGKTARDIDCGAIVVCTGNARQDAGRDLFDFDRILPAGDLAAAVARLPRKDRPRAVGIILDLKVEETNAGTAQAFQTALRVIEQHHAEVYVFLREVRVAAKGLETLYDDARNAGVNVVKYEGPLRLKTIEDGVEISARDALLGRDAIILCQMVGVSPCGLSAAADAGLAALLGVHTDCLGQMQDNNAHLFPALSNRPGIFLAGACRSRYHPPEVIADAKAAAMRVHSLLSRKHLIVELSNATVETTKCALCLTCARTCPHGAMTVDDEKRKAVSRPETCQRCGICVGECPARAIELPASVIE
ncbi:MAG: FAD-dependent oxidoreductase [Verrucomicrobiota bacterium]|nr:FAD-dependent oxidoreductase [Verrucomicrobiota bacterium]